MAYNYIRFGGRVKLPATGRSSFQSFQHGRGQRLGHGPLAPAGLAGGGGVAGVGLDPELDYRLNGRPLLWLEKARGHEVGSEIGPELAGPIAGHEGELLGGDQVVRHRQHPEEQVQIATAGGLGRLSHLPCFLI